MDSHSPIATVAQPCGTPNASWSSPAPASPRTPVCPPIAASAVSMVARKRACRSRRRFPDRCCGAIRRCAGSTRGTRQGLPGGPTQRRPRSHCRVAEAQAGMLGADPEHRRLPSPGRLAARAADRDPWRTGAALLPVLRCRERRPGGASARPVAAALRRLRWGAAPPVVLFEEMLPEEAIDTLYRELRKGFDAVLVVGTTASFPIVEPVLRTRQAEASPRR